MVVVVVIVIVIVAVAIVVVVDSWAVAAHAFIVQCMRPAVTTARKGIHGPSTCSLHRRKGR
jgi:hypothetical protein